MISVHVRLTEGQSCIYLKYPDRTCYVHKVHDTATPVLYDVRIPIGNGPMSEGFVYAYKIAPSQLRAVDEIHL